MKSYIGTKVILAEPEEKDGQEGYKVVYPDGYASWSPKDVFETAYREITDSEFDLIIDAVTEDQDEEMLKEMLADENIYGEEELSLGEDVVTGEPILTTYEKETE